MIIKLNKNELNIIYNSLRASKDILDKASLIAFKDLENNPTEYFKYAGYLSQINPLIQKVKEYLNKYNN